MMTAVRKILIILSVFLFLNTAAHGFNVRVLPDRPVGGQALSVAIDGPSSLKYEITFDGETYEPYPVQGKKGVFNIFLPLEIEASGRLKLAIQQIFWGIYLKRKDLSVTVEPRKLETVLLKQQDESMRDKQPFVEEQQDLVLERINARSGLKNWSEGFMMPMELKKKSNFAFHRKGPKYDYFHKGVDISAKLGDPVKASNDGIVILAHANMNVYGNALMIDHGQGVISCYFHLKKMLRMEGERVTKGQVIAEAGSTGWSTGPHLHFAVYIQGKAIDPLWWMGFTGQGF